jgi:hypothetical protein
MTVDFDTVSNEVGKAYSGRRARGDEVNERGKLVTAMLQVCKTVICLLLRFDAA